MTRQTLISLLCIVNAISSAGPGAAAKPGAPTYTPIYGPSERHDASLYSINNSGSILGEGGDSSSDFYFHFDYGFYTRIDFPKALGRVGGNAQWNSRKQIVGTLIGHPNEQNQQIQGFLLTGQKHTVICYPKAIYTVPMSINDKGQVAGIYSFDHKRNHAFLYSGGKYTNIDPKGIGDGAVVSVFVNNLGHIAGAYKINDAIHSYLYRNGATTQLQSPKIEAGFSASGINDKDEVVGNCIAQWPKTTSYVWRKGSFERLSFPGVQGAIMTLGINNRGVVVGYYRQNNQTHGFMTAY